MIRDEGVMKTMTSLTDADFASILEDETKRIPDDVIWREDEDHSPAMEFRVDVESENGWPLLVKGRCNRAAGTLNYALILRTAGRIYALDLGKGTTTRGASRSEKNTSIDGRSGTETRKHTYRRT